MITGNQQGERWRGAAAKGMQPEERLELLRRPRRMIESAAAYRGEKKNTLAGERTERKGFFLGDSDFSQFINFLLFKNTFK